MGRRLIGLVAGLFNVAPKSCPSPGSASSRRCRRVRPQAWRRVSHCRLATCSTRSMAWQVAKVRAATIVALPYGPSVLTCSSSSSWSCCCKTYLEDQRSHPGLAGRPAGLHHRHHHPVGRCSSARRNTPRVALAGIRSRRPRCAPLELAGAVDVFTTGHHPKAGMWVRSGFARLIGWHFAARHLHGPVR